MYLRKLEVLSALTSNALQSKSLASAAERSEIVFLLILDSLGSIELLFIAIMALVFFGPRKLPQISRTIGKNLAEFRRASEDFKRTWDREVALEEFKHDPYIEPETEPADEDNEYATNQTTEAAEDLSEPLSESVPDNREVLESNALESSEPGTVDANIASSDATETADTTTQPEPMSKKNWL